LTRSINMAEVLDALVASFPGVVVQLFIDYVAKPLIQDERIEQVEIADREPEPAFA
jgi:hypothetical protein